jgi:tRNA (cmo5U34)-methyltransferase
LFVNAEQVLAPTPELEVRAHDRWIAQATALGAAPDELAAAQSRMTHDRCATLEDQLRWLRDAGFADVDCAFKSWRFAVYSGRRPPRLPCAPTGARKDGPGEVPAQPAGGAAHGAQ